MTSASEPTPPPGDEKSAITVARYFESLDVTTNASKLALPQDLGTTGPLFGLGDWVEVKQPVTGAKYSLTAHLNRFFPSGITTLRFGISKPESKIIEVPEMDSISQSLVIESVSLGSMVPGQVSLYVAAEGEAGTVDGLLVTLTIYE